MPLLNVEHEPSERHTWEIFFFFGFFFFEEEEGSLVPIELNAHTAECMNPLCSTRSSKGPAKIKHLAEQMKKKICYLTTYI